MTKICNQCGGDPEAPPSTWRTARLAKGWDCRQAAKAADVSPSMISRIENGHSPSLGSAVKLARAYGVTIEAMVAPPAAARSES